MTYASWYKKQPKIINLVAVIAQLAFSYGFVSLAIDRGNLWWYFFAIFFFVRFIVDLLRLIGKVINGHKPANA